MAKTAQEEHLENLFDNPESGPESEGSLPEKGSVLDDLSETEESRDQRLQGDEDSEDERLTSGSTLINEPNAPRQRRAPRPKEEAPQQLQQDPIQARLSAEAEARRKEITRVRRSRAADRKELKAVKDELLQIKKAITGEDDNEIAVQAQLDANPALKKIYERINEFENRQPQQLQLSEEEIESAREVMEYGMEAVNTFRQHTPDWDGAYAFLREQQARSAGIDHWNQDLKDQQLNAWEHEFTTMLFESGMDPAQAVYEQALRRGWRAGTPVAQPNGNGRRTVLPQRTVRRIRDAVSNPSLSTMGSGAPGSGDTISREEFYRRYDKQQRVAIYNSARGEDIFERLATEGQVPVALLI